MVAHVGREEHVGMKPSEKGKNAHEEMIQEFCLENMAMTEFVHGVDEEVCLGAVETPKHSSHGRKTVRGAGK